MLARHAELHSTISIVVLFRVPILLWVWLLLRYRPSWACRRMSPVKIEKKVSYG